MSSSPAPMFEPQSRYPHLCAGLARLLASDRKAASRGHAATMFAVAGVLFVLAPMPVAFGTATGWIGLAQLVAAGTLALWPSRQSASQTLSTRAAREVRQQLAQGALPEIWTEPYAVLERACAVWNEGRKAILLIPDQELAPMFACLDGKLGSVFIEAGSVLAGPCGRGRDPFDPAVRAESSVALEALEREVARLRAWVEDVQVFSRFAANGDPLAVRQRMEELLLSDPVAGAEPPVVHESALPRAA